MLFALGVISAFFSWAVIAIFRRWAINKNLLDQPNQRSLHIRPTPRGAGIGIVLVVLIIGAALQFGRLRDSFHATCSRGQISLFMGAALLIAVISWLDDIRNGLSPGLRLAVHAVAAGLAVSAVGGWDRIALPFFGTVALNWIGSVVMLVWIVGLINAYNFMDGIDGLAGVQSVTAALAWVTVGILSGNPLLSVAGTLLGSSTVGFLIHNWTPAKVFLGDVGSAFLGFSFAVMPLCAGQGFLGAGADRVPIAGFLIVAPFVMDAAFTFFRRLVRKEKALASP